MVRRGYFEHTSPGGSTPRDPRRRAGYRGGAVGETIAFAVPAATPGAHGAPLAAGRRPHRRILLNPAMRDVGVGIARGAPLGGGTRRRRDRRARRRQRVLEHVAAHGRRR